MNLTMGCCTFDASRIRGNSSFGCVDGITIVGTIGKDIDPEWNRDSLGHCHNLLRLPHGTEKSVCTHNLWPEGALKVYRCALLN
jgi:hypothetical protein